MNIIGLDPGKRTGFAIYHDFQPHKVGEIDFPDIFVWLNHLEVPHVYVVESYYIRPAHKAGGYQHQWNEGEALQVIGAVKCTAAWHGVPVQEQQAAIKPVAAKHSGLPYDPKKKGRGVHQVDAMLHVEHYIRKNNLAPKD